MNHELVFFFQSVLWGAALLFFYDILRIGRRLFPRRVFLVSVEDLLYWIFAGIFLFGRIYQANEGRLRGYSIVAVVLGMVIYTYSISGRFVSVSVKILNIPLKFMSMVEKRLLSAAKKCKILISKAFGPRLRKIQRRVKGRIERSQESRISRRAEKARKRQAVEEKRKDKA